MSAWTDLVGKHDGSEWLALCDAALQEIQEEQSRRNARTIRSCLKDPNPLASIFQPFAGDLAADLIDPDVP